MGSRGHTDSIYFGNVLAYILAMANHPSKTMDGLHLLLILLSLFGGVTATHPILGVDPGMMERLQEDASSDAWLYLPIAVSPTSPCGQALSTMSTALQQDNQSLWAASMVDSWGKNTDGIYIGNKFIGVYDECVAAASPDKTIKGKYCTINMMPKSTDRQKPLVHVPRKLDFSLVREAMKEPRGSIFTTGLWLGTSYATCMPNVCTASELQDSLIEQTVSLPFSLKVVTCVDPDVEIEFTDQDVGFMALVTFILVLIGCASVIDIYIQYTNSDHLTKGSLRYLLVFSAYTNVGKILQVNPEYTPGNITCLHAMRTLSMIWVIWCHEASIPIVNVANIATIFKRYRGYLAQVIINGYPSVDTFFFMSGLLVSLNVLKEVKRSGSFNIFLYYFHRIIRLLPPIAIMCGFVATVMRFLISGPIAHTWYDFWQPACSRNWWKDIAFVNNLILDELTTCLGQGWYISADFQMYIVGPIIILPLYFITSAGKAWLFILTVVSVLIPGILTYQYNFAPNSIMSAPPDLTELFFKLIYLPPWSRASPWIAGIWIGYFFFKQGNTRYKMSPIVVTVGWTLATITGYLVIFGLYSYNQFFTFLPYDIMTQVTYGGLHRLAWGAALGWMVFACHNGYGGLVNGFLSHPVWQPFSRLTYTTYLVAFPLQYCILYSTKGGIFYYTHLNLIMITVACVIFSVGGGLLLSLMAESPVVGLEKLLIRRSKPASKPQIPPQGENVDPQDSGENGYPQMTKQSFNNPAFTVGDETLSRVDRTPTKEDEPLPCKSFSSIFTAPKCQTSPEEKNTSPQNPGKKISQMTNQSFNNPGFTVEDGTSPEVNRTATKTDELNTLVTTL